MRTSRRSFLISAVGLTTGAWLARSSRLLAQPRFVRDPYTLGIASGYPSPDGVILWTRLAPDPLAGGGMPPQPVEVSWEVAGDETFRQVVRRGSVLASPQGAHSVHVEVKGLEPSRWYWYRFRAGDAASPAGRTRTAPSPGAAAERMRFAFASCQQYEQGYYAAYRHMAREDLDLVCHLGDYIYESSWGHDHVRKHEAGEPHTLGEYRNRYACYKSDSDLQAAHAAFPWVVTWDDHEVQNDYANAQSQDLDSPDLFLKRRAAAYQAYYEHMPLPQWARPRGPAMHLYARWSFGALANFHVLDDRQYRSPQACPRPGRGGSNVVEDCGERLHAQRTLLGPVHEQWLFDGLAQGDARWNIIARNADGAGRSQPRRRAFWTRRLGWLPHAPEVARHIAQKRWRIHRDWRRRSRIGGGRSRPTSTAARAGGSDRVRRHFNQLAGTIAEARRDVEGRQPALQVCERRAPRLHGHGTLGTPRARAPAHPRRRQGPGFPHPHAGALRRRRRPPRRAARVAIAGRPFSHCEYG
jgi:alkaline phosphatase D